MKKSIALALALVLALAFAAPALAAPEGALLWDDHSTARDTQSSGGMDVAVANGDGNLHLAFNRRLGYDEDFGDGPENGKWGSRFVWGNWGQALNIWTAAGTDYKYLTINIKGEAGGEEDKLVLDFSPEDTAEWAVYFDELVLADGSKAKITTGWQELKIDLAASGLPGMTNRMHIRAWTPCTIDLGEMYFSEAGTADASDGAAYVAALTVPKMGGPNNLPVRELKADAPPATDPQTPAGDKETKRNGNNTAF